MPKATKEKATIEPRVCPHCGYQEVTVAQAAVVLGVSYQAVHNFIEQGKLPGAYFEGGMPGRGGGLWRIPLEVVEELAEKRGAA